MGARGLFTILGKWTGQQTQAKSQTLPSRDRSSVQCLLRDSMVVSDNNNYLTSVVSHCGHSDPTSLPDFSSNFNWTRKSPLIPPPSSHRWSSCWVYVAILVTLALSIAVVMGILIAINTRYVILVDIKPTPVPVNLSSTKVSDLLEPSFVPITSQIRAGVSKQAWLALQQNNARQPEEGSVDDSVQFTITKDKVHRVPCGHVGTTPCCQLNKSTEVLLVEGCSPVEVPKNQCVGGCDRVFVDGNPFMSIPKCQPVRTRKLKFDIQCGPTVRRVKIEVISRCGCA